MNGQNLLQFGAFTLDVESGELWRESRPIKLRPLAGRALIALAERAGQVIGRDELRRLLWPDTVVAWDQSLNQCIRQIRRALEDDAGAPSFVETIPRRGYRFTAAVVRSQGNAGAAAAQPAQRWRPSVAFMAGAATALSVPVILFVLCVLLAGSTPPGG